MAFVLAVRCTANEGEDDRVAALLAQLAEASRQEAGCRFYQPCRDPENPRAFLIFEIYDDQAAFEAHGASEHFQALGPGEAFPLLESRERAFYETLD
jgi:quinol monooxygenase YgiN